jgi:glycosyltransferase involved in cell wall biosynthesis
MIVGIDASNLRRGGGITHLVELLRAGAPAAHGISQVIVWGGGQILAQLEDRPWLVKSSQPLLDRGLPWRAFWQRFRLAALVRACRCDVLFVPGGLVAGHCQRPAVAMSRNLLPFEGRELRRYGLSWLTLKWLILRVLQRRTFRAADGVIFLTRYARDVITRVAGGTLGRTRIIPHGVDSRFALAPREQLGISRYDVARPFRVLYVSIIDMYKHQWQVVEAVSRLRSQGLPVTLDLVGPAYPPALRKLHKVLDRVDPERRFTTYVGAVPHEELPARYAEAQLCVFASSCENMPNILLEGMTSGLPIACSARGPMPEVLGEAGVYFDPESSDDIARAMRQLIESPQLRAQLARAAFERAQSFSWQRCAGETFGFLAAVAAERNSQVAPCRASALEPGRRS